MALPTHVECIDSSGTHDDLVVGQVYEVISETSAYSNGSYQLKGVSCGWLKTRFKDVSADYVGQSAPTMPTHVECIDAGGGGVGELVEGQVYEVECQDPSYPANYKLKHAPGLKHLSWMKRRFKPVESKAKAGSFARPIHDSDAVEDRMWQLMRPSRLPDECACGTKKAVCVYHKEA